MSKFYLLLEAQMDENALKEKGLKKEDVLRKIVIQDSDVVDGYEVFPQGLGLDISSDFLLKSASAKIIDRGLGDCNPLKKFIETEVPYRITEILELPTVDTLTGAHNYHKEQIITSDELNELVEKVMQNTDIMFDYDKFDAFLAVEYEKNYRAIVNATYTSVWDGGLKISSPCKVNTRTFEVFDIQPSNVDADGLDFLEEEYIVFDNDEDKEEYNVYEELEMMNEAENVYWRR